MEQRTNGGVAALLVLLMLVSIPIPVAGDVVIRSEVVDLFPSGTFDNSSEWALTTQYGFTPGVQAHWTESMITDSHLSFTHQRPQNVAEDISWALYSPTSSNLSLGVPDGGYSWSKGPEIELTNFDMTGLTVDPLLNATLMVAFAIPETLQDDQVRIEIEWDGNIELLTNFAHTPSAIDNMQGNPLELSLDGIANWTYTQLENLLVTVDYVSVGGVDDSEVRVDAVGIKILHQTQWSGLDSGKAVYSEPLAMTPFEDFDLSSGSQNNLITTSCGLEVVTGGSPGGWVTPALQLPHDQSWGRIHFFGNASVSIEIQSSTDGTSWSSGVGITDGSLVSAANYLRADVVIFDGCVSGLRIDFNDPTLSINGEITGMTDGLQAEYSYLSFALGTNLLSTQPMTVGSFSLSIPVGRFLPANGENLDIGVGARFYWSSNGVPETVVAQIEGITLSGGFLVEWDYDPICERPADVYLNEDDIGDVVSFRNTCSDDITPINNLIVTAESQNQSLVQVSVEDGRLVFNQQEEQSGVAPVDINVFDERGNLWSTTIDVLVASVDDPPTYDLLPKEVLVPVGEPITITLNVQDIDTEIGQVSILTDTSWATIDQYRNLNLAPLSPGTFDISISFTDGTTTFTESITVLATSDPDLLIESVEFDSEKMIVGSVNEIKVWVRNDGWSPASLVSIRCFNGQTLIDSANITHISAQGLESASCYWQLPMDPGNTSLRVYVDPTHDIFEISETNNEYSSSVQVLPLDNSANTGDQQDAWMANLPSGAMWIVAASIILAAIIALQLGPGKIRRES
ncbi:MAG: hypothetical protein CXX81_11725 [Methanobacteriota archaeon]|nr:MAG: hypothetical protein CXX81_11725 [Euryarchaeota archaeon]HIO57369.1 hypothetical protein [Candidatus Poseidoniales archaeon]HIO86026.1 hypothetical protein [Candidatus Poseidoniales archaeon]